MSRHIKREKASLPVDARGSKTSLLKVPNFSFKLQTTRAESSLTVPGPGEANKEKLHDLEFNFGKLLLLLLVLC